MRARGLRLVVLYAAAFAVAGCVVTGGDGSTAPTQESTRGTAYDAVEEAGAMILTSPAFEDGGRIPRMYSFEAENLSPPLTWSDAPPGTRSFAITCVDLAPVAHGFVHWLVVDIPPGVTSLPEGASMAGLPGGARDLARSDGRGWSGPYPPVGTGDHVYEFTLYALDIPALDVPDEAQLKTVLPAMNGHILETAKMSGTYVR